MKIKVGYANNVKSVDLEIDQGYLNIFYGHNGTGKSTIAEAVKSKLNNEPLDKYKSLNFNDRDPIVDISKQLNCAIYNQDFIDNVVFNKASGSFVNDSFELLVKDENISKLENDLTKMIEDVEKFTKNEAFAALRENVKSIIDVFTINIKSKSKLASDKLNKTKGFKKISHGNPVMNTAVPLKIRRIAKKQKNSVQWAKWWKSGVNYINDERCPYCGEIQNVGFAFNMSKILNILSDSNFDTRLRMTNTIEELNGFIFKNGDDFNDILKSNRDVFKESNAKKVLSYLTHLNLLNEYLDSISKFNIDEEKPQLLIKNLEILLKHLKNLTMTNDLKKLISHLKTKEKDLKIAQNKIKSVLKKNVISKENAINEYLELCNIDYKMAFKDKKLVLVHKLTKKELDGTKHLLSYGEKNSIALLIFVLLNANTNSLIILDDPISSYDEEKKYAIYSMIFKKSNLKITKGNYVIYFTHDFENIIEFKRNSLYQREIKGFILNNNNGDITLKEIKKEDIKLISDYYGNIINNSQLNIVKLVYIRKLIELKFLEKNKQHTYNYISSVIKGKVPQYKSTGKHLDSNEINLAKRTISKIAKDYDEDELKLELETNNLINNYQNNRTAWYEKIVLFRAIGNIAKEKNIKTVLSDSLERLSKMSYHIENERVLNLDPLNFNNFPSNIEKAMDLFVEEVKKRLSHNQIK